VLKRSVLVVVLIALSAAIPWLGGCGYPALASTGETAGETTTVSAIAATSSTITSESRAGQSATLIADNRMLALSDTTVRTKSDGEGGVMVTGGGAMDLAGVNVITSGDCSPSLSIGPGGGTITASDVKAVSTGEGSPCVRSAGSIGMSGGTCKATKSQVVVIEGAGSLVLDNVALSSKCDTSAVTIFRALSGVTTADGASLAMSGGSLVYASRTGSMFSVSNCTANIELHGVEVVAACPTLLTVATGGWNMSGSSATSGSGGHVALTADEQTLAGDVAVDAASSVDLVLEDGSVLTGAINAGGVAKEAGLTLDAASTWNVTADSYLTSLTLADGISGNTITNIVGNGHTVYYDTGDAANSALGGLTYKLSGGGLLQPPA
jgi:hypothetical protein